MNKFLRATVAAVIPVAPLVCVAAAASASSATEFTVGYGGPGFDGSVVVQSLPDASVIAVTKHGFGPGGSTSIRRIGVDGSTAWVTTLVDGADNGFYGAEYISAALLDHETVLVAGYADPAGAPNGHFDNVLLAVKADGRVSTVDTWGGPGSDFGREIDVCADGSFYVGGGSWDASASPAETDAIGMADIFVTRFGADMTRQWTRAIGSTNNDNLYGLNCRADDSVDLNAWAAGSVNGQGSNAHYNFFTARMDASGNTVRTIVSDLDPGEWNPQGGAYAPDGSYYVVGESNSEYPGLPCTERALGGSFVSHYSEDGVLLWRSILACANLNRKIAVGASGDLFVLGGTDRRVADQQKFGGSDILIHRYSPDGTRITTRQFGSELDDVASSMSIDSTGHLFVGGYSKGTYDGYTAVDDWDALVMRFDVGDVVPPTTSTTAPVVAQSVCTAATTTMLADSDAGRPIWFYGDDIGEARMAALWDYASTHNTRDFGRDRRGPELVRRLQVRRGGPRHGIGLQLARPQRRAVDVGRRGRPRSRAPEHHESHRLPGAAHHDRCCTGHNNDRCRTSDFRADCACGVDNADRCTGGVTDARHRTGPRGGRRCRFDCRNGHGCCINHTNWSDGRHSIAQVDTKEDSAEEDPVQEEDDEEGFARPTRTEVTNSSTDGSSS